MTKLYKFYSNSCAPCAAMDKVLKKIEMPQDIELIYLNVGEEKGREEAKKRGIFSVPALSFESGNTLIGMKTEEKIKEFIYSHGESK